jgi:phthiocerol/phenolphthiocerol synthesis type-I polyketide synthase C
VQFSAPKVGPRKEDDPMIGMQATATARSEEPGDASAPSVIEIQEWLVREVATSLRVPPSEIDPTKPLADYGLDSIEVAAVAGRLEDWLNRYVSPALLWEHPTIAAVAAQVAAEVSE